MKIKLVNKLLTEIKEMLSSCNLCERKCGVNRLIGETGYCGLGKEAFVFKDFIRVGEEGGLSPSHAIYFSGCNMHCLYCSNSEYIKPSHLSSCLDCKKLAERIDSCSTRTSNVNFIGGEPTVNLLAIVKILSYTRNNLPIIWNSNMYASLSAMEIIDSFTDIYLADFKFWDHQCSQLLADTDKYLETVTRNLLSIKPGKRIIIRHLPLKGHLECCSKPIIDWISDKLPTAELSIIPSVIPNRKFSQSITRSDLQTLIKYTATRGVTTVVSSAVPEEVPVQSDAEEIITTNIVIQADGSIIFQDLNGRMAGVAKNIQC